MSKYVEVNTGARPDGNLRLMDPASRAPCLCDEIEIADRPCMVCDFSYDLGIGAPPNCTVWPPLVKP